MTEVVGFTAFKTYRFFAAGADHGGQAINFGLYTLRYCMILRDSNHLGASPILDFVSLIRAAEDTNDADALMSTQPKSRRY